MRNEEYYHGILSALGVEEDVGVPDPVWRHEKFLKLIYDALKARGVLPVRGNDDKGKYLHLNQDTGAVEWNEIDVSEAIAAWLDDHAEATSAIEDGSITRAKLSSDLQAATDAVPGLSNVVSAIEKASTTVPASEEWENGRIVVSTGTTTPGSTNVVIDGVTEYIYAIRTKDYLTEDVYAIIGDGTAYPVLFAYNSGSYVGWLNGDTFSTSGVSVSSASRFINVNAARRANPTYDFKAVVFDSSATSSQPVVATLLNNVSYLYGIVSDTEFADAINKTVTPYQRWENGKLSTTGQPSNTNYSSNIRYADFVEIKADSFTLAVPTGYYATYFIYNAAKQFQSKSSPIKEKTVTVPITNGYFVKLQAFNTSQTDISPYEGSGILVSYAINGVKAENDAAAAEDTFCVSLFESAGVIGDSFASGELHDPLTGNYVATNYAVSWPQIMGRDHGMDVVNFSEGGLTTKTWLTDADHGLPALLADDPLNLYIIALGANDAAAISGGTMSLGTIADVDTSDYTQNPDSFYGNYGRIIGNILTHAPHSKIVCLSVAGEGQRHMDEHIQAVAKKYRIPFIDLTQDPYFTSHGFYGSIVSGYPLAYGYSGMEKAIVRLLEKCMLRNMFYFSNYAGATA